MCSHCEHVARVYFQSNGRYIKQQININILTIMTQTLGKKKIDLMINKISV